MQYGITKNKRNVSGGLRCCVTILLLLFFAAAITRVDAQTNGDKKPSIRLKATPSRLFQGESFYLQVLVDNIENPQVPDMSYLNSEFAVEYVGSQNRNSTTIFSVNGKEQRVEERGIAYNYRLIPKKTGTIRIEPPEIRRGNVIATAFPITIEVIPPGSQNDVRLELRSSVKSVYPMTPFDITLSIFIRALPGEYADLNPVRALVDQIAPSVLAIPWVEDGSLPKGLVPNQDWQTWVANYRSDSGGFRINNIRSNSPFDFGMSFFDNGPSFIVFLPEGKKTTLKNKEGKNEDYWQYDFTRSFFAESPGTFSFDAASIKGAFAQKSESRVLSVNNVYATSNAVVVTVKDVPEENCPDDYVGALGQFTWNAALTPHSGRVGEAFTLTMTLSGKGSVLNAKEPKLDKIAAITENFKIYPPTEEIKDNTVCFTWSIRPTRPGKIVFPPVPISYFDVKTEKFVSLKSQPVPLEISQSESLTPAGVSGEANLATPKVQKLEKSTGGIFANRGNLGREQNQRITLRQWTRSMAATGLAGVFFWCLILAVRSEKLLAFRRRSDTLRDARRDLLQAMTLLASDDQLSPEAVPLLKSAFFSPIKDLFDKPISTLTESEIRLLLNQLTKELPSAKTLLDSMNQLCDHLENLRYGQGQTSSDGQNHKLNTLFDQGLNIDQLFDEWIVFVTSRKNRRVIKAMMTGSSPKKSKQMGTMILVLFSLVFPALSGCGSSVDHGATARFQEAIALFDQADQLEQQSASQSGQTDHSRTAKTKSAEELFAKSAAVYQGMLNEGIESGPILYNQGNAWFRAGDKARALAAWRKALRYMPRDPYLKANIESIVPVFENRKGRPLAEVTLFWQNFLSYPSKYRIAFVFAVLLITTFLGWQILRPAQSRMHWEKPEQIATGPLPRTPIAKLLFRLTIVFLLATVVMTVSALYDWNRFDRTQHVVVSSPEVIARKGNSLRYEAVFASPLPIRTEGELLESKGTWLKIRFPDGQDGWIEAKDAIVY
ncbi:MAG: BatD family protein [Thermoguttaceae bacterium]|nr:BatD family protein [Thermoguttaceae bacterium]